MTKKKTTKRRTTKNKKPTLKTRIIKLLFGIAVLFILLFSFLVLIVWSGIFAPIPQIKELQEIQQKSASLIFASDGSLIGKYYTENRQTIDNDRISPYVRHALIATEDNRFFEHHGFDIISLGRVFVKTILMGNMSQGGGSTISQQLAKNLYPRANFLILSLPANKIREIIIASTLEKAYSKDEILTLYLNTVPFGEDVYGIEAAARRFFNKPAVDLNISESATLVGMLAANTAYSPRLHPELSMKRRNIVISRMVVQGFIPEKEAAGCKQDSIVLDYTLMDANRGTAPYFRSQLYQQVTTILREKYADRYSIKTDGLRIYTTINSDLQNMAEKAVHTHMRALQKEFDQHWKGSTPWINHPEVFENALAQSNQSKQLHQAGLTPNAINAALNTAHPSTIFTHDGEKSLNISTADSVAHYLKMLNTGVLVVNPQTGAILTWIGGINHKYLPYDHITSTRQVGSTFKPIVYATALEQGISPCSIYANEQRVYETYENWSPSNSEGDYTGFYSLKGALVNSVNTVAAEVILQTGIEHVREMAKSMGIRANIPPVPSIALGTPSISLLEMLRAYTTFPNEGYPVEPFGLLRIEDSNGTIIYEREEVLKSTAAMGEETAQVMNELLQGVVNRGTGRALRTTYGLKGDIAGKTGTTQNNADGWFIAYTPKIVIGVWVGAEQPSIHFRSTTLGQGAHMALPIVGLTLQQMSKNQKLRHLTNVPFRLPNPRLAKKMDCLDFYETKPTHGLFEMLLDMFSQPDSIKQSTLKTEEPIKKEKKKDGFFKKLRKIFNDL